jgi:hypothetical protein
VNEALVNRREKLAAKPDLASGVFNAHALSNIQAAFVGAVGWV